jgi:hypothetical protein
VSSEQQTALRLVEAQEDEGQADTPVEALELQVCVCMCVCVMEKEGEGERREKKDGVCEQACNVIMRDIGM